MKGSTIFLNQIKKNQFLEPTLNHSDFMEYIFTYLQYFTLIGLSFLLSLFVGAFLLNSSKELNDKPFFKIFLSAFSGQLFFVAVMAIFCTKGKTVFIAYPFIYAFYLFHSKKVKSTFILENIKRKQFSWSNIALAFVLIFFAFSWSFFVSADFDAYGVLNIPSFNIGESLDYYHFYTNVGYFIQESGNENIHRVKNVLSDDFTLSTPYHYYDLWLNNFFSTVFNANYLKIQYFVSRPLMLGTTLLGVLSIAEFYSTVKVKHVFYTISFAFVGPLFLSFLQDKISFFAFINPFFDFLLCITPHKTAYYYSFIIAGLLFLKSRRWVNAQLFFVALPIASITAFPALMSLSFALPIVLLIFKFIDKKQLIFLYILIVGASVFFAIPYLTNNASNIKLYSFTDLFFDSIKDSSLSSFLIMSIKSGIHKALYFVPLFLLLWLLLVVIFRGRIKESLVENKILIVSLFFVFLGGIVAWNTLNTLHDSYQLLIHPMSVLINSIFFFALFRALNIKKLKIITHLILFLCVSVNLALALTRIHADRAESNPFSNDYLEALEKISNDKIGLQIVASYRPSIIYSDRYFQGAHIYFFGHQLQLFKNDIGFIGIDDFNIHFEYKDSYKIKRTENLIKEFGFYHFVEEQKKKGIYHTVEQYQIDFLREYKIAYLVYYKDVTLPSSVEKLIAKRVIDSKSGEVFCVLKYN